MARNTPIIRAGILVGQTADTIDCETPRIEVGSKAWFAWLDQADSFIFDDPPARFSVRKRRRGHHQYWYGLRRIARKLYEVYLGQSATITLDTLRAAAARLSPEHMRQSARSVSLRSRQPSSADRAVVSPLPGKAWIPQVQPLPLVQTRALARLNRVTQRQLTLIVAPAGYGKTTLVAQWIEAARVPAAWVTLDAADNDPARFWTYLCAAFDAITPGLFQSLGALIQVSHPHPPDAVLATLIRGLTSAPDPTILVLDDYHMLRDDNAILHEMVALLQVQLPAQIHLVLISRQQPPFTFEGLRAQGQLLELHITDLKFTLAETTALLAMHDHLDLSADAITQLHARTDGWVAGLKLAALSPQRAPGQARRPGGGRAAGTAEPNGALGPAESARWIEPLTHREQDVLMRLARGWTNKQIAADLVIQPSTVKEYVHRILDKLNVDNRTQAVLRAMALKLVDPDGESLP